MLRLAEKDGSTAGHTRRVATLAVQIGERLGLPADRLRLLALGGLLHDMGKLSVPDAILNKPGKLTDEEFDVIRRHPAWGRELLTELGGFPELVLELVESHHERLDGRGYPNGAEAAKLELEVRILTVADVYDALTADRVYREAWPAERALGPARRGHRQRVRRGSASRRCGPSSRPRSTHRAGAPRWPRPPSRCARAFPAPHSLARGMRAVCLTLLLALGLAAPAQAIYHGQPEPAAASPWLVALTTRGPFCGGALIAPDRVLTAAHCVQGQDPHRVSVRIGGGSVSTARRVAWKGAFFPTDYREIPAPFAPTDPFASATINDVAVIVLAKPVTDIAPLGLAQTAPADGEAATTVGRGVTGPLSDTTQSARVATQTVLASPACTALFGSTLLHPALHLCTREDNANAAQACGGDSGSPVMVLRDGALQEAGVVTWGGETQGHDCGGGPADVSERTLPHLALITGPRPAFAPYPQQRVRVRRHGSVRTCVIGAWSPSTARFGVRWFRQGPPQSHASPDDPKRIVYAPGTKHYVGHGRTLKTSRPVACEVTARTSGGWASAESYNRL